MAQKYVVLALIAGEWDVLAYGREGEPQPQILARRNRAQVFASREEAEDAVNITYSIAVAEGYPWAPKAEWKLIPIVDDESPWIGSAREKVVDNDE